MNKELYKIVEKLKKFKEKDGPGPANMRQIQIDEIKKSKNLASIKLNTKKYPFDKEKMPFIEATLDNFHKKTTNFGGGEKNKKC